MAKRTLRYVGDKALKDPAFWRALRKDPGAALEAASIQLSASDLRTLRDLLRRNLVEVHLDALMNEAHNAQRRAGTTFSWRTWITWLSWRG